MTTVGVVTVCSDAYREWLVPWAESVAGLNRRPDRVVVACESAPPPLPVDVQPVIMGSPFDFPDWLNAAIDACDTDWIAWIGVDDTYLPHALDTLDATGADVVCLGARYQRDGDTVQWIEPTTTEIVLAARQNHIACGSPFRRRLWERYPFQPHLQPWADWGFWISCAAQGAVFEHTGRVDFEYRWHADTPTVDPVADEAVRAWASTCG